MRLRKLVFLFVLLTVAVVSACSGKKAEAPAGGKVLGSEVINGKTHVAKLLGSEMVISGDPGNQQSPSAIFLPDKDIWFVCYEDSSNVTTGSDIYGQFINSNGTAAGGRFLITGDPGNQTAPQAAYRQADGKIVVVWQDTQSKDANHDGVIRDPGDTGYIYYTTLTNIHKLPPVDGQPTAWAADVASNGPFSIGFNPIRQYNENTVKINEIQNQGTQLVGFGDAQKTTAYAVNLKGPLVVGSVRISSFSAGGNPLVLTDNGSGALIGGYAGGNSSGAGTVNYDTGAVIVNFASPPGANQLVSASYSYYTWDLTTGTALDPEDNLVSRSLPKVSYDPVNDKFIITYNETRSITNRVSGLAFGFAYYNWRAEGSTFAGYVHLKGSDLTPMTNPLGITGPDIFRDSQLSTMRLMVAAYGSLSEHMEYEGFANLNNINNAVDTTAPQNLSVFEGKRIKLTIDNTCNDKNNNGYCDVGEVVTMKAVISNYDDGNVHVYSLFNRDATGSWTYATRLDTGNTKGNGYKPAPAFDPVTKKFLVVWEDGRDSLTQKIYGQLLYSGGGLYGNNIFIGYQDLNSDKVLDPNVAAANQTAPFVAYDSVNERYFVAWQDGRNGANSPENLDVFGQYVDLEGSLRGSNYAIATAGGGQLAPVIAYNSLENQFLAVWKDSRNASTPAASDIYGQRFSLGQPQLTLLKLDNTPLEPALIDFGSTTVNEFATLSFKIKNTGDTPINIDAVSPFQAGVPFNFDDLPTALAAADGTCLTLVPSAEITLTVRFSPIAAGTFSSTFTINSDAGQKVVTLQGTSVAPNLTVQPAGTIDFGNIAANTAVKVGQHSDVSITIVNNGNLPYTITSISGVEAPFSVSGATTGITMAPGTQQKLTVTFTPVKAGTFPGQLLISTDKIGLSRTVNLKGEAVAPTLRLSAPSIDFGQVNVNTTKTAASFTPPRGITVYNDGNDTLTITNVSSDNPAFAVTTPSSPSIPPGSSTVIDVAFTPNDIVKFSGNLKIETNAGNQTVALSGQGAGPRLVLTPTQLDFGVVALGQSKTLQMQISNTGNSPVNISSITSPAAPFSVAQIGSGPTSLLPGTSATILVTYTPTAEGQSSGSFIVSSDSTTGDMRVDLQGSGTAAKLTFSPGSQVTFSQTAVGETQSQNFSIVNGGQIPIKVTNIDLPQAPFTLNPQGGSSVPFTLQPGEKADYTLQFTPTSATGSPYNATIGVLTDSSQVPTIVRLSGTVGKDTLSSSLAFLDSGGTQISSTDFGGVFKGSQTSRTVQVKNAGNAPISIASVSSSSSAFTTDVKSFVLAANATQAVTVYFLPTALATYNANLVFKDGSGNSYPLGVGGTGITVNVEKVGGTGNVSFSPLAASQVPTSGMPDGLSVTSALQFAIADVTAEDTDTVKVSFTSPLPSDATFYTVVGNNWVPIAPDSVTASSMTFRIGDKSSATDSQSLRMLDSNSAAGAIATTVVVASAKQVQDPPTQVAPASSGGKSGCFIATAAFGSYLDPHVVVLRHFRDNVLLKSAAGRQFVSLYYEYSPPVADFIAKHDTLRLLFRWALTPLIFGAEYPKTAAAIAALLLASLCARYLPRALRRGGRQEA